MPIALTSTEIECDVNANGAVCWAPRFCPCTQNPPFMEAERRSVFVVRLVKGPFWQIYAKKLPGTTENIWICVCMGVFVLQRQQLISVSFHLTQWGGLHVKQKAFLIDKRAVNNDSSLHWAFVRPESMQSYYLWDGDKGRFRGGRWPIWPHLRRHRGGRDRHTFVLHVVDPVTEGLYGISCGDEIQSHLFLTAVTAGSQHTDRQL